MFNQVTDCNFKITILIKCQEQQLVYHLNRTTAFYLTFGEFFINQFSPNKIYYHKNKSVFFFNYLSIVL